MKQDKARRTPKWVLPVAIAAAVLVVVGVVLAIFLGPWNQGGSDGVQSKLYWNVDRITSVDPETGISNRAPGADGLFTIRFAVDGEQVEYKVADKRLVNSIDFLDVMGLVFDADGMIIEALAPNTIYTELAKDFYVKSVSGDKIVVNSSLAMNGMQVEVPLSDATGVYNVEPVVEMVGQPDTCQIMDKVTVYANADGVTTHVFITERAKGNGVYYRVDQFYDKASGSTTREPDENGIYTMPFAHDGQLLDLKCKDKDLVSKLDSLYNPKHHVGLIFDEEGYIVDYVTAAVALRGKLAYGYMSVTAADGNTVTIEDFVGEGADGVADLYIDADCDIFLVEDGCEAEFIGQRVDSLQVGDLIYVYTDLEDKPILIYIYRRTVEAEMYYNVSRKYNSTEKVTTRTTDENGWYVYDMITLNKRVELRTKDKDIATKVDSFSGKLMGLKLQGTTIVDAYDPNCLAGYSQVGIGRYVTMNMSNIIRIVSSSNFESGGNYLTADGHILIDATGDYSAKTGGQVTLREGDRVTAYKNPKQQISHGVVTQRYYEGTKLYYNVTRSYSSAKKETKRTPDENGYYVFDMVCEGKEVQVKTKDKAMASFIDADTYRFRALKVSKNGIIQEAYQDVSAIKYGNKQASNVYYDSTNPDGTINYYYMSNGERVDKTTAYAVTADTRIYNYSEGYVNYKGERTTLQKGDKIQGFGSAETRQIQYIFVRERKVESKLYWYTQRKYTSTTKETTREPDANGYYWVDLISEDGEIKTFKTKDKKVMSKVDSFATAFGLKLKGDVIVQAYPHTTIKGIGSYAAGYYDAMEVNKDSIVFVRNRPASQSTGNTAEYPVNSKHKVVNACTYSDNYGAKDKIGVGDRVANYTNEDGEIICTFIVYENTHKQGAISYCEHCGKEVWWEHFVGTFYDAEAHYYLTSDYTGRKKSIGYNKDELAADETLEQYEVVMDLNGYTWTSESSNVTVYSTFSIVDTVGGGKMVARDRCVTLSSMGGATLNLYGGTLTESETEPSRNGGVIYANNGTINMYGGTITGGIANKGGNLYIAGTTLNMYGGTISNGYAPGVGGNIYAFANSVLNIQGGLITGGISDTSGGNIELAVTAMDEQAATFANCTISDGTAPSNPNINIMGNKTYVRNVTLKDCVIGGDMGVGKNVNVIAEGNVQIENGKTGGIKLPSGSLIDISNLSKESKIVIFARGVFTTERDDIADFVNCFVPAMEGATIVQEGKALAYVGKKTEYTIEQIIEITNSADFAALFANGGSVQTVCPVCGEEVEWTPVTGPVGEKADGHYYLNNEADYEHSSMNYLTLSNKTCLYLNNKEVKINGRFRASKELHIMGPGTITRLDNEKYPETPMFNLDSSNTKLHIYGGTFINQQAGVALFNMTSVYSTGSLKIYGGTFESTAGDILVMDKEKAKVELMGGTFKTGDLKIDAGSLKIGSATVKGSVIVAKDVALELVDAPVISKVLDLTSGAKANVSGLNVDASIVVKAEGFFTIASTKAPYLLANNTFTSYEGYQDIVNVANRLWTDKIGAAPPAAADPKTTEEIIEITNSAEFAEKFANGGVVTAFCPVCGIDVEWTPIGAGTAEAPKTTQTELNDHVYYDQDTWTTSMNILTGKTDIACLFLNGKTVNGTGRVRANRTINIMGSGTIIRSEGEHEQPMFALDSSYTKLSIYGGTYINKHSAMPLFSMTSTNSKGSLKVYAGTFESTAEALLATNEGAKVELQGGTFKTGDVKMEAGSLKIGSATVEDSVIVAKDVALELVDAPVISKVLDLTSGAKAIVSNLNAYGSIVVKANGYFTIAANKASSFITNNTFTPYEGYQDIIENAKRLWTDVIGAEPPAAADPKTTEEIIEITNSAEFAEKFANGGVVTAFCPVCGIDADWTPIGAGTAETPLTTQTVLSDHVYYDQDTWTTSTNILTGSTDTSCVYLNGKTVTGTGRIRANKAISIVGSGKIIRNDGEHDNPMFALDSANTKLSIYGGEFVNKKAGQPLFDMTTMNANGDLTVYGGTFESTAGPALVVSKEAAEVALLGGTFKTGDLQMNAGSLEIGSATVKTSVIVAKDVALELTGTPKVTGVLDLTSGAKAIVSNLNAYGSIVVKANGYFTIAANKASSFITNNTFTPYEGYQDIIENAKRLWTDVIGAEPPAAADPKTTEEIIEITNSAEFAEKFANGGVVTAFCPVCGIDADWTPIGAGTAEAPLTTQTVLSDHVYYDQDTWTTSTNILTGSTDTSCVYLNGKTVNGTGRIRANRTINIMGSGTIIRSEGEHEQPMFALDSSYTKLSIYGGTYINKHSAMPLFSMISEYSTGSLTVYGGTFESTAAEALLATNEGAEVALLGGTFKKGNLKMDAGSLRIGAATVETNINVAKDVELVLTGAPQITGVLDLTSGVKAKLSSLSSSASIKVKANGFFTHTSLSAQTYVTSGTFVPAEGYQNVVANANRLWTDVVGVEAPAVEAPKTTEEIIALTNSDEFAAKFANGGVVTAFCPVCGVDVEWAPIGAGTAEEPSTSSTDLIDHVYYDQDTWTSSQNILAGNTDVACLYLNGKTVTGIGRIRANKTINIMGSGKIIKTADEKYGEYLNSMFYLDSANTKLSIYGGEFINQRADLPLFAMTSENSTGSLMVYGGTFDSVSAPVLVENNTRAKVELYGGTFKSGALQVDLGNLTVSNATLEDDVIVSKLATLQLTGKPTITGTLDLTSGAKVVLNALDTEANILVKANGLFTREASKLSKYVEANTFKVPEGYSAVAVAHNALWTDVIGAEAPAAPVYLTPEEIISIANSEEFGEKFAEGGDVIALCPACNEEVVWIPVTGNSVGSKKEGHYYLNKDNAEHGSQDFLTVGGATEKLCLYLNDMHVSLAGHISANRTLNLMGNGTLTRTDSKYDGVNGGNVVSLLDATSSESRLNVYGGTYINNEPNMPLIRVNNTGKVNIYGGTFENAVGADLNMTNGTVNLAGGTFKKGALEVDAGSLTIGNTTVEGNVIVDAAAELQLTGAPKITGNLDLTSGAKATLNALETSARIKVMANGVFTETTNKAADYITEGTFTAAAGYQTVEPRDNALWTAPVGYVPPATPVWPTDTKERIDQWLTTYAADFTGSNVPTEVCPFCGDTQVTWRAVTSGRLLPSLGDHLYLAADITAGSLDQIGASHAAPHCIYLNNHTYTSEGTFAVKDTLNIFDNPNVAGGGIIDANSQNATATYEKNPSFRLFSGAKLNIYYGEYQCQQAYFTDGNGNGVNVNGTPLIGSYADGAQAYIYGATLKNTGYGEVLRSAHAITVEFENCTLNGGVGYVDAAGVAYGSNIYMTDGTVTLKNTTVTGGTADKGSVYVGGGTLNLAGTTSIAAPGLTLANGVKADVTDLATTSGAIVVNGEKDQVIATNGDATKAGYFTVSGNANLYVDVNANNQLYITDGSGSGAGGENPGGGNTPTLPDEWSTDIPTRINQWTAYYGDQFTDGAVETVICPICGATDVTWTARNSTYTPLAPGSTATHYYLAESYGRTTQDMIGSKQSASLCLYLNNKTYTTIGRFLVQNQVNIFDDVQTTGGGITKIVNTYATAETPSKTSYLSLPMFDVSVNGDVYGELNIYGGHYENQQTIVGTYNPDGTPTIRVNNANAALNIYGGSFANTGNGAVLDAVSGAVKIADGSIAGSVNVAADASIALGGATTITGNGLTLAADVKADVTDLATGSNIVVNGVKDQVIATNGDATKAGCFTVSGDANLTVDVNTNNELFITDGSGDGSGSGDNTPTLPTWSTDIPTRVGEWTDYYGAQFTGENVETAICPVCGATDVEWTAKSSGRFNSTKAAHYYLADNISFTTSFDLVGSSQGVPICIYLNNKTYTATGTFQIKNTLNIFDDPDVTGGGMTNEDYTSTTTSYIKHPLFRLCTDDTNAAPVLNIYYGEYKSEQAHVSNKNDNGTALIGSEAGVAQTYIYGATLQNTGYGEVLRSTGAGTVELVNCTLNGGSGYVNADDSQTYGGNIYMEKGTVTLKNTTVTGGTATNGSVYVGGGTLKLSGKTSIAAPGLVLATDVKVTLDELDATADITVKADGAFTVANDDAAQYAAAFKPAEGYRDVYELDKVLYTGVGASTVPQDAKTIIATANSDTFAANFASGDATVRATCPACNEEVDWTRVTAAIGTSKSGHFYFNHADDYAGHTNQNFLTTGGKVCLYLNNKSVEIAGRIGATREVNIMGNGIITRVDSDYDGNTAGKEACSLLNATSANTVLNIYGGTYINNEPDRSLLNVTNGKVNIYAGTFQTGDNAVMTMSNGTVNLAGGTFKSGALQVSAGSLKIGTANVIGNVTVTNGAAIELTGAPLIKGTLDLTAGILATLTDLAEGTNVTVMAEGKFTAALDATKATEYAAYFTAAEGYEAVTVVENALSTRAVVMQAMQLLDETTHAVKA